MIFNSLGFVLFFVLVTAAYYAIPFRFRWLLLLGASVYFYMAFVPAYILVLAYLIVMDFFMAHLIERSTGARKRWFFLASIIANVGTLFVFKYFNFFNSNLEALAGVLHWNYPIGVLKLILPLGLSFHTFQSLSYVIEVYRGTYKAERHLGIYALYVLFFPQLVAGPIERPQHLLPQFHRPVTFNGGRVWSGLQLMGWGFFKKIVIADRVAAVVDFVYGNLNDAAGLSVAIAIVLFAFQLYADFSGYSDIARGSARVLGFDLMHNFNAPYFSASVAEFWRRWHISLSNWFRDYVYFPLARARRPATRTWLYACIFITFAITGLWHGAGWTYLMLGAVHGSYLVLGLVTKPWRDSIWAWTRLSRLPHVQQAGRRVLTFILVSASWVFFRAPDLTTAMTVFRRLFQGWSFSGAQLVQQYYLKPLETLGISRAEYTLGLISILALLAVERWHVRTPIAERLSRQPLFVRSLAYSSLVLSIVVFGVFTKKEFIYFQF